MTDELVDIVDNTNRILRQAAKCHAHRDGWLHRTVIGEVRDPMGNFVMVRQSLDRQDAGQFVSPVGGHARAGETERQALVREAIEENGVGEFEPRLLGRFIFNRKILGRRENHYFIVFTIELDPIAIKLEPEAVEYRIFHPSEVARIISHEPRLIGDAQHAVLRHFHPELMP